MTPLEACTAKAEVVAEILGTPLRVCPFGRPNAKNPDVTFAGCPGCHRQAESGKSVEDIAADMRKFMQGLRVSKASKGTGQ